MSQGIDGVFIAGDSRTNAVTLGYASNCTWVLNQCHQAVNDYNFALSIQTNVPVRNFGIVFTGIPGNTNNVSSGWFAGINQQSFFGASCLSPSCFSASSFNDYIDAFTGLSPLVANPWLTGLGHFFNSFTVYGAPGTYNTNLISMGIILGQSFQVDLGYVGDPYFTNGGGGQWLSTFLPAVQSYLINSNITALYADGRIYAGSQTYANTTTKTFIWQAPLGQPYSQTRLLCLHNTNTSVQTIICNVTNFSGTSNMNYSLFEPYSGNFISNFQNSFTFTVATNSCNLLKVQPGTIPTTMTTGSTLILGQGAPQNYGGSFGLIAGYQAAFAATAGNNDVYLGYQTGYRPSQANNTWVGYGITGANPSAAQGSSLFGSQCCYALNLGNNVSGFGASTATSLANATASVLIGAYGEAANLLSTTNSILINTSSGDANLIHGSNDISIGGAPASDLSSCIWIGNTQTNATIAGVVNTSSGFASTATNYGGSCYNSSTIAITNKTSKNIQLDLKVVSGTVGIFNSAGTCVGTNTTFISTTGELEPILQPGGYITNTTNTVTIEGAWAF